MTTSLTEQINLKRLEIEHYKGVLHRYGSGRWLDMGRRHLAELESELDALNQQLLITPTEGES